MPKAYLNRMSKAETIRKGAMSGTDMDYESADAITTWVLENMPFSGNYIPLTELPARIAGFQTEWVCDTLVRNGVFKVQEIN